MTQSFSVFGVGPDGIPEMFASQLRQPGGGERLANLIIDGSVGARVAPDYLRTLAVVLLEWYRDHPPIPDFVFRANAAANGMLSADTAQPSPPPNVKRLLGYPTGVNLRKALNAAGRDAAAIAMRLASQGGDLEEIVGGVEQCPYVISRNAMEFMTGIKRTSLDRRYRDKSEYRHLVNAAAEWLALEFALHGLQSMTDRQIARAIEQMSTRDVLDMMGSFNPTPPRPTRCTGSLLDVPVTH